MIELSIQDQENIRKDIDAVLEKYNAEIHITSTIHILKRQDPSGFVVSPYGNTGEEVKEETNTETKESSESNSGEPSQR